MEQTVGVLKRAFEMSLLGLTLILSFDFYDKKYGRIGNVIKNGREPGLR